MEYQFKDGQTTIIDDDCVSLMDQFFWKVQDVGCGYKYVQAKPRFKQKRLILLLHRVIMREPEGLIDHINGNTLDNRKANLRVTTYSLNRLNSKSNKASSSKFRGVSRKVKWGKYVYFESSVGHNGETHWLGAFKNEVEAAKAYDQKVVELYGPDVRLNFPLRSEMSALL